MSLVPVVIVCGVLVCVGVGKRGKRRRWWGGVVDRTAALSPFKKCSPAAAIDRKPSRHDRANKHPRGRAAFVRRRRRRHSSPIRRVLATTFRSESRLRREGGSELSVGPGATMDTPPPPPLHLWKSIDRSIALEGQVDRSRGCWFVSGLFVPVGFRSHHQRFQRFPTDTAGSSEWSESLFAPGPHKPPPRQCYQGLTDGRLCNTHKQPRRPLHYTGAESTYRPLSPFNWPRRFLRFGL